MLRDETDQHIDSLRARVGALKSLTHRIDEETQQQAALADRLQAAVEKTQAAMSRTMRRVDKAMASGGTSYCEGSGATAGTRAPGALKSCEDSRMLGMNTILRYS